MVRYEDDGTVSRTRGEHYHVEGEVTLKVWVSFDTKCDEDDEGFDSDLSDAISDSLASGDWEVVGDPDIKITIERDEE